MLSPKGRLRAPAVPPELSLLTASNTSHKNLMTRTSGIFLIALLGLLTVSIGDLKNIGLYLFLVTEISSKAVNAGGCPSRSRHFFEAGWSRFSTVFCSTDSLINSSVQRGGKYRSWNSVTDHLLLECRQLVFTLGSLIKGGIFHLQSGPNLGNPI